ncbi:hypothetical protein HZH68_004269 [Vespula germanica]|uniref:Uncharacterized protein n=1 Tax=Vespula germanica TaxID=30212 RepID=A0A834KNE8_VESGE|nr:hypothetical protein HZH68_004269 [Vespula germanica]
MPYSVQLGHIDHATNPRIFRFNMYRFFDSIYVTIADDDDDDDDDNDDDERRNVEPPMANGNSTSLWHEDVRITDTEATAVALSKLGSTPHSRRQIGTNRMRRMWLTDFCLFTLPDVSL